jgi:hypothetical protein
MRNEGALDVVLKLVDRQLGAKTNEHLKRYLANSEVQHFYSMCFRFLGLCAHHNHDNQKIMLEHHAMHFLSSMSKYGISAESVLASAFGEKSAIEHLGHHTVHIFVNHYFHDPACRTAAYIRMLSAITAPGGVLDRDQQNFVTKELFMAEREASRKEVLYGVKGKSSSPHLFLGELVKTESFVVKQKKKLKKVLKVLNANKKTLLCDHVHSSNKATYHDSVSVADLTKLMLTNKAAATSAEAIELVKTLEAAHVIYPVTKPKSKADTLGSNVLYRFVQQKATAALVEAGYETNTKSSTDDLMNLSAFELSVELAALFGRLADNNPEARATICADISFDEVMYPLQDELFAGFSVRSKICTLKLARSLYLFHLEGAEIGLVQEEREQLEEKALKAIQNNVEETGFGFDEADASPANTVEMGQMWLQPSDDPDVYIQLAKMISIEVKTVVEQLKIIEEPTLKKGDPSFDLHLSDDYIVSSVTPLLVGVIEHSIRALESLAHFPEATDQRNSLQTEINGALLVVATFYTLRKSLDESGLGSVDSGARRHGATHLEHFVNIPFRAELEPAHKLLEPHLDSFDKSSAWWHGETAHHHGHGNKGSHKLGSHKLGTRKHHGSAKHGSKKGSKKGSHKANGNLSALGMGDDEDFHHKSETEKVMDELRTFRHQVKELMIGDHTPLRTHFEWMMYGARRCCFCDRSSCIRVCSLCSTEP